jgi:hypothetical protein
VGSLTAPAVGSLCPLGNSEAWCVQLVVIQLTTGRSRCLLAQSDGLYFPNSF